MANIGTDIAALDYNQIRNEVDLVLGTGLGPLGYGQPLSSTVVQAGNEITADHWTRLRNDIVNISLHQSGVQPSIASIGQGALIRYSESSPNFQYASFIEALRATRFSVAPSRTVLTFRGTKNTIGPWNTQASATATIQFNNADEARYFFNSGGKIKFSSSRTEGLDTAQNRIWSTLLTFASGYTFGAGNAEFLTFYDLTDSYQPALDVNPTATYSNNRFVINAKCDVANNERGEATRVDFQILWIDNYTDPGEPAPGDEVDGILTLTVEEIRATGSIVPSGLFLIEPPTYSFSEITKS